VTSAQRTKKPRNNLCAGSHCGAKFSRYVIGHALNQLKFDPTKNYVLKR